MINKAFRAIILLTASLSVYAQTTAGVACSVQTPLSAELEDAMNLALVSAFSGFEKNPVYSSANAEFSSAMDSFPASVTSSLLCSGYSGINTSSPPTWLASVPAAVLSIVLKEQQVYQSIIGSFEAEASMTSSAAPLNPQSTISSSSTHTIPGVSTTVSPTNPATSFSSSAAIANVSGTLTSSFLVAVSLALTGIL